MEGYCIKNFLKHVNRAIRAEHNIYEFSNGFIVCTPLVFSSRPMFKLDFIVQLDINNCIVGTRYGRCSKSFFGTYSLNELEPSESSDMMLDSTVINELSSLIRESLAKDSGMKQRFMDCPNSSLFGYLEASEIWIRKLPEATPGAFCNHIHKCLKSSKGATNSIDSEV